MYTVKSANYVEAKCSEVAQASLLVSTFFPEDGKIYKGNALVWTEGVDGVAMDSYDNTAEVIYARLEKLEAIKRIRNS